MSDAGLLTAAAALRHRASAAIALNTGNAPAHLRNIRRSCIDRLQPLHDALPAMPVADPRAVPRVVEIDTDPTLVANLLQNAVTGEEIDFSVAEIVDAFEKLCFF